jgi:hypothetical protein
MDSNPQPTVWKSICFSSELLGNVFFIFILMISIVPEMVEKEVSHYDNGSFSLKV